MSPVLATFLVHVLMARTKPALLALPEGPGVSPGCRSPRFRRHVLEEPTEEELIEKLQRHPHLQLCR